MICLLDAVMLHTSVMYSACDSPIHLVMQAYMSFMSVILQHFRFFRPTRGEGLLCIGAHWGGRGTFPNPISDILLSG